LGKAGLHITNKSISPYKYEFVHVVKGVVHLGVHSPPCHPRCPCLSFFSRKEIKVFDENIPGLSQYNGLHLDKTVQMRVSVQFKGL